MRPLTETKRNQRRTKYQERNRRLWKVRPGRGEVGGGGLIALDFTPRKFKKMKEVIKVIPVNSGMDEILRR